MEISLSCCGITCTHLDILIAEVVEEKEEVKNLLTWNEFSFHVMVDRVIFTYVKNEKQLILVNKKIFNGVVWSHSLIFLIYSLLGIIHLESMFRLRRNQVVDLHNQKLRTLPE